MIAIKLSAALATFVLEPPSPASFPLAALLGLRRGEVTGLRWCDFDLDARTLTVSHQVQGHGGRVVICPPRTDRSLRPWLWTAAPWCCCVASPYGPVLVPILRAWCSSTGGAVRSVPAT